MDQHHASLKTMADSHWRDADRAEFIAAWNDEVARLSEYSENILDIVAGLLLPVWKRLPDEPTRVYRLQTDGGERNRTNGGAPSRQSPASRHCMYDYPYAQRFIGPPANSTALRFGCVRSKKPSTGRKNRSIADLPDGRPGRPTGSSRLTD
jgi:hypothetical protein